MVADTTAINVVITLTTSIHDGGADIVWYMAYVRKDVDEQW